MVNTYLLKQRIHILENNGVIDADSTRFVDSTIDMIAADYPELDHHRAAAFVTHLAMAVQRIRCGKIVSDMDGEIWEEIRCCPAFQKAAQFSKKLFSGSFPIPETEKKFLMVHICSMLDP